MFQVRVCVLPDILVTHSPPPLLQVQTLRELMLSAEASYDMAMKFAILKERMLEHNGFPDATINAEAAGAFEPLLRVFLPKPAPYMGQVRGVCGKQFRPPSSHF